MLASGSSLQPPGPVRISTAACQASASRSFKPPTLAELAPEPVITVAHDHLLHHYHLPAIRPALRKAYAKLDCIVSVAEAAASGYRKEFPELAEKIHYIPNAVRSLGVPASTGEARLVVTAGRLADDPRIGPFGSAPPATQYAVLRFKSYLSCARQRVHAPQDAGDEQHYLQKPFTSQQLLLKVKQVSYM